MGGLGLGGGGGEGGCRWGDGEGLSHMGVKLAFNHFLLLLLLYTEDEK